MSDHVLIVYELIPDETQIFLIPAGDVSREQTAMLDKCAGRVVNNDDLTTREMESADMLSKLLDKEWAKHRVRGKSIRELMKPQQISHVCWTGFLL